MGSSLGWEVKSLQPNPLGKSRDCSLQRRGSRSAQRTSFGLDHMAAARVRWQFHRNCPTTQELDPSCHLLRSSDSQVPMSSGPQRYRSPDTQSPALPAMTYPCSRGVGTVGDPCLHGSEWAGQAPTFRVDGYTPAPMGHHHPSHRPVHLCQFKPGSLSSLN